MMPTSLPVRMVPVTPKVDANAVIAVVLVFVVLVVLTLTAPAFDPLVTDQSDAGSVTSQHTL